MMSAKLYWEEAVDYGQGHRKTIYDVFSKKEPTPLPVPANNFVGKKQQ